MRKVHVWKTKTDGKLQIFLKRRLFHTCKTLIQYPTKQAPFFDQLYFSPCCVCRTVWKIKMIIFLLKYYIPEKPYDMQLVTPSRAWTSYVALCNQGIRGHDINPMYSLFIPKKQYGFLIRYTNWLFYRKFRKVYIATYKNTGFFDSVYDGMLQNRG